MRSIFLLLLFVSPIFGQIDARVSYPEAIKIVRTISQDEFSIDCTTLAVNTTEKVSAPLSMPVAKIEVDSIAPRLRVKSRTAPVLSSGRTFYVATPGEHVVEILGIGLIDGDLFFDEIGITVKVGNGPNPPPTPPDEDEDDEEDQDEGDQEPPIPGDGYRVLIVYESADLLNYPSSQIAILSSPLIKTYLDSKTARSAIGSAEWRALDQDIQFADPQQNKIWIDALNRERTSLPWIVISNGSTGFEGPLPANVQETLELLKRYE